MGRGREKKVNTKQSTTIYFKVRLKNILKIGRLKDRRP